MRFATRLALAIGVMFTAAVIGQSSWGPSGCSGQSSRVGMMGGNPMGGSPMMGGWSMPFAQSAPSVPSAPLMQWRTRPDKPDEIYLYRSGVQVGGWSYTEGTWRDYNERMDAWGPKTETPPAEPPGDVGRKNRRPRKPRVAAQVDDPLAPLAPIAPIAPDQPDKPLISQNFGVDLERMAADEPKVTLNGRPISPQYAIDVITGNIPDDSKKFHLVVIGSDAERKPVMDAWMAMDATTKDRISPWSVPVGHWSLNDGVTGKPVFTSTGHPTVYMQSPDGKVLHRQDDAVGAVEAIRKAVKDYDAAKDPDLRKPSPITPVPVPTPTPVPTPAPAPTPAPSPLSMPLDKNTIPWLLLAGGAVLFVVFKSKGKV